VDTLFLIVLVAILACAVISFAVMGLRQHRRSEHIGTWAYGLQLRFATEDPIELPLRLGRSQVFRAGHSCRATNVCTGRSGGRRVQTFDLRYECGHGTRRHPRQYCVAAVGLKRPRPWLLMWDLRHGVDEPLPARITPHRHRRWRTSGALYLAETLSQVLSEDSGQEQTGREDEPPLHLELFEGHLLLAAPLGSLYQDHGPLLERALALAERLDRPDPAAAEVEDAV
jgi:hypothetical protein